MPFSIAGLATAVPEHTMSCDEALAMSRDCVSRTEREDRLLRAIFRRARIDNRHLCVPYSTAYEWVPVPPRKLSPNEAESSRGPTTAERMRLYAEHASPLAVRAAQGALRAADRQGEDVTHLVTVSCTGFEAPGVDVELIERLGLPTTIERVHIGFMGCHGAINAMRVALGLIASDREAKVLLSATELCSLHFCFSWETERILGNALFADGSASMLCTQVNNEPTDAWQVVGTGSCLFRETREAITWRLGDHGFEMSLSNRVPELIHEHLRPWLQAWLDRHKLSIGEIGSWAIHPGGPRIIDAVEEGLGLTPETTHVSREVLREHGNMSSPTVLFILERLRRQTARRPCVALGFGPGLVAEAALLR